MIPGQADIIECPHCKSHKDIVSLLSGNTFDAKIWSDNKVIYPMLPKASFIQKCPNCGKYFFLNENCFVGKSQNITLDTGKLNYFELKEVYYDVYCNENTNLSDKEKQAILWEILWSFNDRYKRKSEDKNSSDSITIPNIEHLYIETIVKDLVNYVDDHLLKAELYREIGNFDEAFREIYQASPSKFSPDCLIQNCLALIKEHNSDVVDLTNLLENPKKENRVNVNIGTKGAKSKYSMPLSRDPVFFKDLAELMKIVPSTFVNIKLIENEIFIISNIFSLPKEHRYPQLVDKIGAISKAGDSVKQSFLTELAKLIDQVDEPAQSTIIPPNTRKTIEKRIDTVDFRNGDYHSLFSGIDQKDSSNKDERYNRSNNIYVNTEQVNKSNNSNKNSFFLLKLYNGEYSLGVSFWLFGIVVFFAIIFLTKAIPRELLMNRGFLATIMMCELMYRIVWSIGTIKSGLNHKGSFILKWLAIAIVCILAITYILSFFGTLALLG